MREVVPLVLLACACGAATWSGRASDGRAAARASSSEGGASDPAPSDHAFLALEALGDALAPGMRRVAERTTTGGRVELVRAGEHDACVRVAFEASAPLVAKLLDAQGVVVVAGRIPAAGGAMPEQGPFCIRKGEAIMASADGPPQSVRWIAWATP